MVDGLAHYAEKVGDTQQIFRGNQEYLKPFDCVQMNVNCRIELFLLKVLLETL